MQLELPMAVGSVMLLQLGLHQAFNQGVGDELARIVALAGVSKNTFEMASKSLAE